METLRRRRFVVRHHLHLISHPRQLHCASAPGQDTSGKSRRSVEPFCVFCESNGHWAQDCKAVTDVKEHIEKLKSAAQCFLCLNHGHHMHACSKRGKVFCSKCKKEHHQSVCMDKETTSRASPITSASVGRVNISSPDFTYLETACVWVTVPTGLSRLRRCMLDGGSQCSFIARSLIDDLQVEVTDQRDLSVTAFETTTAPGWRRFVRFNMRGTVTNAWYLRALMPSLVIPLSRTILRHWRILVIYNWLTPHATQRTSLLRS